MNSIDFELFHRDCDYTDDTVCLIATMDSLSSDQNYCDSLQSWCSRYPDRGYGGYFKRWLRSDNPQPYGSFGNGAAMRIGPVSMTSSNEQELFSKVHTRTAITHNHVEGLKGANAIALGCWLGLNGFDKAYIKARISREFGYDLNRSIDELYKEDIYEETCQITVPIALTCALESNSFEETVRRAVFIGGDSDTNASIAGCLAESLYGIPENLISHSLQFLPEEMRLVVNRFYDASVLKPPAAKEPSYPEIKALPKWLELWNKLKGSQREPG